MNSTIDRKENFSVFSFLSILEILKKLRFFLSFQVGNLENFLGFFQVGRKKLPLKGECVFLSKIDGHGEKRLGKGGSKVAPFLFQPAFLPRDIAIFLP